MAMWKYHEVRENEGLVNQSASANKMGWAAKERWHDAEDADIKCLRDVGSEGEQSQRRIAATRNLKQGGLETTLSSGETGLQ